MDRNYLLWKLLSFVPLLLSLTVHEWAHAYSAYRLGDDTAEREGRLTLDPIAHIDLLGTLILPLFSPFGFGWAKPVPVNPARFRRDVTMRTGMMITAMAGPLSNLLIALVSTVALGLLLRFHMIRGMDEGAGKLLEIAIGMNLVLCLFNFLPIPPLDGSRVVDGLLPYRYRQAWEQVERFSAVGLLVAFVAGGYLLATPIGYVQGILFQIVYYIAGWS
jgi:Zn-dependent protease